MKLVTLLHDSGTGFFSTSSKLNHCEEKAHRCSPICAQQLLTPAVTSSLQDQEGSEAREHACSLGRRSSEISEQENKTKKYNKDLNSIVR
ncbi:hypothetical protein SRHO_G00223220 [Serrasalmus rhombeus]